MLQPGERATWSKTEIQSYIVGELVVRQVKVFVHQHEATDSAGGVSERGILFNFTSNNKSTINTNSCNVEQHVSICACHMDPVF